MDHPENKPGGIDYPPQDAERCVWMTAGLVAYKLCDRDFDCDHCPLDAALRGTVTEQPHDPGPKGLNPNGSKVWDFPGDRRYHPSHTWAMGIGGGRVRVGVDAFAARILGHVNSLVLSAERGRLHRGQVFCWLSDESGLIPLLAPVTGRVVLRNEQVQKKPGLVTESFYDDGWLLDVECGKALGDVSGLLSADRMRERSGQQLGRINETIRRSVENGRTAVGATLPDGGVPITDLRRVLGERKYRRLILRFLR